MKIFTSTQIKDWDRYTTEHEAVKSIDLMERAARAVTDAICEEWSPMRVVVFAGPGNNGGDALAVARMLADRDFKVEVFLFNIHHTLAPDCATNRQRLMANGNKVAFTEVTVNFDPPVLGADTLVVDGLFGAGLNKPLSGGFSSLVKYINQSDAAVVSIDLPSGLMPEDNTYSVRANIVRATLTLTFQQPKLAMFLADNQPYIGRLRVLDIRLARAYADKTEAPCTLLDEADVRALLRHRDAFAHKGDMGHALLIAGSYGMSGAAILAARACMRAGVGKLTVHTPRANYAVMQTAVPEAIMQIADNDMRFSDPVDATPYSAVGIGPGLGTDEDTALAMIAQLRRNACPTVIDADALNILGNHRAWMQQLPKDSILTPHPKELERLTGGSANGCYDRLTKASELAARHQAYVILKGHYSALCLPSGHIIFNSTGNAGMATAGSGDVLTGIITGLLARGYSQAHACIVGMYIHGLAGDIAARELGQESLIASDIIQYMPAAWRLLDR